MIRRTPLKRGTKPLKRTPLRKVSKKRAKEGRIYSQKRKAFLMANPVCQVWMKLNGYTVSENTYTGPAGSFRLSELLLYTDTPLSCDVHHTAKRTGKNYLDESTWLAVCRENHERIHNNPSWARANGFLK